MKRKQHLAQAAALAAFLLLAALPARAFTGAETGWLTDTDGTVTGTKGAEFIYFNTGNFPDENFRNMLMTNVFTKPAFTALGAAVTKTWLTTGGKAAVSTISGYNSQTKDIEDLAGLEYFISISEGLSIVNQSN